MKNRIINALLAYALKDIAAILRFVGTLEGRLETFLDNQQREIDAVQSKIDGLAADKAKLAGDLELAISIKTGVAKLRS